MPTYFGEVADDENWERCHREIKVEADSPRAALGKIKNIMRDDELVYQICTLVDGASLPQPVFDFFNGFSIYE